MTILRSLRRFAAGALVLLFAAVLFSRVAGGGTVARFAEGPAQLEGLTVRYAMPEGAYVQRTFVSAVEARWKVLSGPRQGDQGTETIALKPIAPGIFFVNRVDPLSGETVSEVYNLASLTISIYITRANPDDPLRRVERFSDGRIEIVSAADGGSAAQAGAAAPRA